MANSPDFGIPWIDSGQAQPDVTHNIALLVIQAMLSGALDRGINTPPGSPTTGDVYIIGSAPVAGAWSGRANCVAIWDGAAWRFVPGNTSAGTPITMGARQEGMRLWVSDENTYYKWGGSAWVADWLEGSATYDPPSIAASGTTTTTVTVTDAALGDYAVPSFSLTLSGLVMTAYVSAADTVTVVLFNPTAGAIDIASGTLRARVFKRF